MATEEPFLFLYHYHPLCIQGFAKGSPTYTHLNLMCQLAAALAADTTALLDAQASFEAAFPDILTDMNFPARIYFLSHAILTTTTLCFGAIPHSGMDALLFILSHLTQDLPPDSDTAGETLDMSYFTFSCWGIMHDEDVDDFITVLVHVFPPFQCLHLFTTALLISLELATMFAPTRELLMSWRTILHLVYHLNNPIQILRRSCQPSPATRVDGHVFGLLAVDMLPHPSFTPSYISKTPSLLFMLFGLLALFASTKSKNQESMEWLGKAKSFTFHVLFSYFFTTTVLFAPRLALSLVMLF